MQKNAYSVTFRQKERVRVFFMAGWKEVGGHSQRPRGREIFVIIFV